MITKEEAEQLALIIEDTRGWDGEFNGDGCARELTLLFPGLLFRWDGSQFVVTGEPKAQP